MSRVRLYLLVPYPPPRPTGCAPEDCRRRRPIRRSEPVSVAERPPLLSNTHCDATQGPHTRPAARLEDAPPPFRPNHERHPATLPPWRYCATTVNTPPRATLYIINQISRKSTVRRQQDSGTLYLCLRGGVNMTAARGSLARWKTASDLKPRAAHYCNVALSAIAFHLHLLFLLTGTDAPCWMTCSSTLRWLSSRLGSSTLFMSSTSIPNRSTSHTTTWS